MVPPPPRGEALSGAYRENLEIFSRGTVKKLPTRDRLRRERQPNIGCSRCGYGNTIAR